MREADEECDDGNKLDGDACTTSCTRPRCGDAYVQAGEQCDDGNTENADECSNSCKIPQCGDGVLQVGEECDGGRNNSNKPDACRLTCKMPRCGDKIVDAGEECDGQADCESSCKRMQAAAPPAPGVPPVAFIGGGAAILCSLGFLLRKKIVWLADKFTKPAVGDGALDDIPLDEIEMPWHKW
jgi:cysteine-rich repeat protein